MNYLTVSIITIIAMTMTMLKSVKLNCYYCYDEQ